MRTLDEVIEDMELTGSVNAAYREEHEEILNYLKIYRSEKQIYEIERKRWEELYEEWKSSYEAAREKHVKALREINRNDPLTWDELKTMEGKPIWVEHLKDGAVYKAGWRLIVQIDDSLPDMPWIGLADTNADYCNLEVEWMIMGQWQAYRKEREREA